MGRLARSATAASVGLVVTATLVTGGVASAAPAPASAPTGLHPDAPTITGPLQNSAKSTYLAATATSWVDTSPKAGVVTYPAPGELATVVVDGTCVPVAQDPNATALSRHAVGDGSDCLRFRAEVTNEGFFTFRVEHPGAPADGRYLGDGSRGGVQDLLATKVDVTYAIPEKPSATTALDGELTDADGDGIIDEGDTVRWTATIANTGNVRLRDVELALSDDVDLSCDPPVVDAGAEVSCTSAPVPLSQADVDRGEVAATMQGSARTPRNVRFAFAEASATTTVDRRPSGSTSTLVEGDVPAAGASLHVKTTVRNDGNVTLSDVVASLDGTAITCAADELAPGASAECATDHVVTQDEFDAGRLDLVSTATGTAPDGDAVVFVASQAGVDFDRHGAVSAVLAPVTHGAPGVGDEVGLRLTVTNDGNASVRDLAVEFGEQGIDGTCPAVPLAPGGSVECAVTGAHRVTQADVDAGSMTFTAAVSGLDSAGNAVRTEPRAVQDTVAQAPSVATTVTPTLRVDGRAPMAGDEVDLSVAVENTGNVTLTDVTAALPERDGLEVTCPSGPLAPGAHVDCAVTRYVLTQRDVDHGSVDFSVDVTATGPKGQHLEGSDTASVTVDQQHGVVAVVHAAPAGGGPVPGAGDHVSLEVVVRNSGNVTLLDLTAEVDGRHLAVECPTGALAPGSEATCTIADHELTQAEVDAGSVDFTVAVRATGPGDRTATATDSATVELARVPSVASSATSVLEANEHEVPLAGDTVTVEVTVRNTGNVTVTGVRSAVVGRDGLEADCADDVLAPGEETTCAVSAYALTQADVDAGAVRFDTEAAATGTNRERAEAGASTTLALVRAPAITSTASAALVDTAHGTPVAGDEVDLTVLVHNAGNVTVHGVAVAVRDRTGTTVTCSDDTLAPVAEATCTATRHRLTQDDVDAGRVDFAVSTAATGSDDRRVTASAGAGVDVDRAPAVDATVVAHLAGHGGAAPHAGDHVAVAVRVTNTGNVTLGGVTSELVELADLPVDCGTPRIVPGATVECTVPEYVLTQDDVERGRVTVAAVVDAVGPDSLRTNDRDEVTVGLTAASALDLTAQPVVEDGDGALVALDADRSLRPGDQVRVRYTVVNTGNLTVEGLEPHDGSVRMDVERSSLEPGARTTAVSAPHVVTDAEAAAGEVVLVGQVEGRVARADGDSVVESDATTEQTGTRRTGAATVSATTGNGSATGSGGAQQGATVSSEQVRTVVRAEPAPVELAFTGSEVLRTAVPAGVVLLLGGVLLLLRTQRRRRGAGTSEDD